MIKGTYRLKGKWAARIQRNQETIHLGTFDTEELAAEVYDAACLIFGKSASAYNDPHRVVSIELLQKVLMLLRDKDVLTNDDVVAINNRYNVVVGLAEKLGVINGGQSAQS